MSLRIDTLDAPRPDAVLLRLRGAGARDDGARLAAIAEKSLEAGRRHAVLDLSGLGGATAEIATAIAAWSRRLRDGGGRLALVAPNVAVAWLLGRHLDVDALRAPDAATAFARLDAPAAVNVVADAPPAPAVAERVRPDRDLLPALRASLDVAAGPEAWPGPVAAALRNAGLAVSTVVCVRREESFEALGEPDVAVAADGWLGSMLAGAAAPLEPVELAGGGLTAEERGFLRWLAADVLVPLAAGGRLHGLLAVRTGRRGGLRALRSGELLALALLGDLLGARLAARCPTADETSALPEPVLLRPAG